MTIAQSLEILDLYDIPISTITLEMIKGQFKKLAKVRHPEKGGSNQDFQKLTGAYDLVTNLWTYRTPNTDPTTSP